MNNNHRNIDDFSMESAELVMHGAGDLSTIDADGLASLRQAYERIRDGHSLPDQSLNDVLGDILVTAHQHLAAAHSRLGEKLDVIAEPASVDQLRRALLDANQLLAGLRCDVARIFATATAYAEKESG
jgi:hypothetical protein